jgi:hypothetical protein
LPCCAPAWIKGNGSSASPISPSREQQITVDLREWALYFKRYLDILTERPFEAAENDLTLELSPYAVVWLKAVRE